MYRTVPIVVTAKYENKNKAMVNLILMAESNDKTPGIQINFLIKLFFQPTSHCFISSTLVHCVKMVLFIYLTFFFNKKINLNKLKWLFGYPSELSFFYDDIKKNNEKNE